MNSEIYEIMKDAMEKQNLGMADCEGIISAYERMLALNDLARREGLLALEEEVQKMAGLENDDNVPDYIYAGLTGTERLLAVLISLIIDGTNPEIVEQVAVSRYFASNFEGQTAVAACIVVIGALAIQAGENPWILKQELLALMPEEAENRLIEKDRAEQEKETRPDIPAEFFREGTSQTENSPTYVGFGQLIAGMDDRMIQRVLRDIDIQTLGICLKGADGQTRKKFFDNMSGRVALMLYEEICSMGPIRLIDAEMEAVKIMKVIRRLEDQGEIVLRLSALDGRTIEDIIALQEHKVICKNREIEYKIKELQTEISRLETQIVKL